jgi:hypothetical protein
MPANRAMALDQQQSVQAAQEPASPPERAQNGGPETREEVEQEEPEQEQGEQEYDNVGDKPEAEEADATAANGVADDHEVKTPVRSEETVTSPKGLAVLLDGKANGTGRSNSKAATSKLTKVQFTPDSQDAKRKRALTVGSRPTPATPAPLTTAPPRQLVVSQLCEVCVGGGEREINALNGLCPKAIRAMGFALYFPEHLSGVVFSHVGVSLRTHFGFSLPNPLSPQFTQVVASVLSLASDEFLRWIIEQDLRELLRHVPYTGSSRTLESTLHHLHCDGNAPANLFVWLARVQVFRWEMHLERGDITARFEGGG